MGTLIWPLFNCVVIWKLMSQKIFHVSVKNTVIVEFRLGVSIMISQGRISVSGQNGLRVAGLGLVSTTD